MKRILLPALLIGILLLSACGTTSEISTPTPGATEPSEPEETPDYTSWIAGELRNLNQDMLQFTSTYPIFRRVYDEEEGSYKRIDEIEGGEEVLVREVTVAIPGYWQITFWDPALAVSEGQMHINNAYWLTNEGKLPDEVMARDVSTDEITQEVSDAINLLEWEVSYSYSYQESHIEWINDPANLIMPTIPPDRETIIRNLMERYDDYQEELSEMIAKLELILSRLPSGEWYSQTF